MVWYGHKTLCELSLSVENSDDNGSIDTAAKTDGSDIFIWRVGFAPLRTYVQKPTYPWLAQVTNCQSGSPNHVLDKLRNPKEYKVGNYEMCLIMHTGYVKTDWNYRNPPEGNGMVLYENKIFVNYHIASWILTGKGIDIAVETDVSDTGLSGGLDFNNRAEAGISVIHTRSKWTPLVINRQSRW